MNTTLATSTTNATSFTVFDKDGRIVAHRPPTSGFTDRGWPMTLLCHDCGVDYSDGSKLEARDCGSGEVVVSCPACRRDLATVFMPLNP